MTFKGRLAAVSCFLLCGFTFFAATTIALDVASVSAGGIGAKGGGGGGGGGGGSNDFFKAAGNYQITTLRADYFCCVDPSQPGLGVNITQTTTTSNPLVGPTTVKHETDVFMNACGGTEICGGGCFMPDGASDFTMTGDLSSAAFHTTVTAATLLCPENFPLNLPLPFTIDVTWTGIGPIATGQNVQRFDCARYGQQTQSKDNRRNAVATATTSLFAGSFPGAGSSLDVIDQRIHAEGAVLDTCVPLGAKGAGPGPLNAGDYHFVSQRANFGINPKDPSQTSININVFSFNNVSSPKGAPSSTDRGVQLFVFTSHDGVFENDCFLMPSTVFTASRDLQSATLHAAIGPATPKCEGFFGGGLPESFSVDATWSGTGPVATLRADSTFDCSNFHIVASSVDRDNPAHAVASLSMFPGSLTSNQADIGASDQTFHVRGTTACIG